MIHQQNLVKIKYLIVFFSILALTLSCIKTDENDDYLILNTYLDFINPSNDFTYYLMERGSYPKHCLEQYYIYKYDKERFNEILKRNDSLDEVFSKKNKYGKYCMTLFAHRSCINDSIINKDDLKFLITHRDSIIWDQNKIKNNKVIVLKYNDKRYKEKKNIFPNSITKPIYNKEKNIAIVRIRSYHSHPKLLTYKKINGKWELIDEIRNHF